VIDACRRMAWYIDDRDWTSLGELFDETVTTDYTSVFGGKPTVSPGREFAQFLGSVLGQLSGTQHLVTNHRVWATEDGATCVSQVQASHVVNSRDGGPMWTGSGDYRIDLVRRDGDWRIAGYAFFSSWNTGNRAVMTDAFRHGPAGARRASTYSKCWSLTLVMAICRVPAWSILSATTALDCSFFGPRADSAGRMS